MQKPFTIGILREITDQYESGDISYGKMVEMLNEIAIKWHEQTISKMETTQTAVDWLVENLKQFKLSKGIWNYDWENSTYVESILEQAKQMEKEQIINAYKFGLEDEYVVGSEKYYNETYNK